MTFLLIAIALAHPSRAGTLRDFANKCENYLTVFSELPHADINNFHELKSSDEVANWIELNLGKTWFDQLPNEYRNEIFRYQNGFSMSRDGSMEVNSFLSNKLSQLRPEARARLEKTVQILDQATHSFRLKDNVLVFRGAGGRSHNDLNEIWDGKKAFYQTKRYLSTSFSREVAQNKFAIDGNRYLLEIELPKGTQGLVIPSTNAFRENEFLLPRNSFLEVVGKTKNGDTRILRLRLVLDDNDR